MSPRLLRCLLFSAVVLATVPVQADWLCDFFNSFPQDFKRRNCWPQPFVCPDRQVTRLPFCVETNNGWRKQNLMSDQFFEPKTGELTEAGRLKVHWVSFGAPPQHRAIYVHVGGTPEETAARIAAVQTYVAKIMPQGVLPTVCETTFSDEGSPADLVDSISRKYQSTMPTPRLAPKDPGGGSPGGSGGSQ
jgi:hypothetical protein